MPLDPGLLLHSDRHGRGRSEGLFDPCPGCPKGSPRDGDVMAARASFDVFFPQLRDPALISSPPNKGVILWNATGELEPPCTWRNGSFLSDPERLLLMKARSPHDQHGRQQLQDQRGIDYGMHGFRCCFGFPFIVG